MPGGERSAEQFVPCDEEKAAGADGRRRAEKHCRKRLGGRFLRFLGAMVSLFPGRDRFFMDIVIRSAQD
jgi:hypothetical protein